MIDCSRTENYFAEKQRMTKKHKLNHGGYACKLNCADCPLSHLNNGSGDTMLCSDFETCYPEKAIAIVQKWSDEHPQKTYLSEFLKNYPNAPLIHDGTPCVGCSKGKEFNNNCTDCTKHWLESEVEE